MNTREMKPWTAGIMHLPPLKFWGVPLKKVEKQETVNTQQATKARRGRRRSGGIKV